MYTNTGTETSQVHQVQKVVQIVGGLMAQKVVQYLLQLMAQKAVQFVLGLMVVKEVVELRAQKVV